MNNCVSRIKINKITIHKIFTIHFYGTPLFNDFINELLESCT